MCKLPLFPCFFFSPPQPKCYKYDPFMVEHQGKWNIKNNSPHSINERIYGDRYTAKLESTGSCWRKEKKKKHCSHWYGRWHIDISMVLATSLNSEFHRSSSWVSSPFVFVRRLPGVNWPPGGNVSTGFVFFLWLRETHFSNASSCFFFVFFLIYLAKPTVHFQVCAIQDQWNFLILPGCSCSVWMWH